MCHCKRLSVTLLFIQPTASNFPGERAKGEEGGFFIPQVIWLSMFPSGVNKLLPLSLWLCFQYLGKWDGGGEGGKESSREMLAVL